MYLKQIEIDFVKWVEPEPTDDPETTVEQQVTDEQTPSATKLIRNGQLYILHNGCYYNVLGTNVK